MKKFIKHTILLLCLIVSTSQAMHVVGHLLNSHDNSTTDLFHIAEHKCSLCNLTFDSSLPNNEIEPFVWNESPRHFVAFPAPILSIKEVNFTYFSLRAPPVQI